MARWREQKGQVKRQCPAASIYFFLRFTTPSTPTCPAAYLTKSHAPPFSVLPPLLCSQIAILMGCAVLPHLRQMVEIVEHGLVDEQQKVTHHGTSAHFAASSFRFCSAPPYIIS